LELHEISKCVRATFGEASQEVLHIDQIFNKLDLDGTGRLTYTEFCAAAMEEDDRLREQVMRLAFNAFDCQAEAGKISEDALGKLLASANANESLPKSVCETVAREVVEVFDCNRDGCLDFDEFKRMMYSFAKPDAVHQECLETNCTTPAETLACLDKMDPEIEGLPLLCSSSAAGLPSSHHDSAPQKQRSWASNLVHKLTPSFGHTKVTT